MKWNLMKNFKIKTKMMNIINLKTNGQRKIGMKQKFKLIYRNRNF